MDKIRGKGAVLNVLDLPSFKGVDDPALKSLLTNLVIEIYKYTAQHEREQIRERQRKGIEIAKSRGAIKYIIYLIYYLELQYKLYFTYCRI